MAGDCRLGIDRPIDTPAIKEPNQKTPVPRGAKNTSEERLQRGTHNSLVDNDNTRCLPLRHDRCPGSPPPPLPPKLQLNNWIIQQKLRIPTSVSIFTAISQMLSKVIHWFKSIPRTDLITIIITGIIITLLKRFWIEALFHSILSVICCYTLVPLLRFGQILWRRISKKKASSKHNRNTLMRVIHWFVLRLGPLFPPERQGGVMFSNHGYKEKTQQEQHPNSNFLFRPETSESPTPEREREGK